jgi:hypothetical protein
MLRIQELETLISGPLTENCIPWPHMIDKDSGYGRVPFRGNTMQAHRASYILAKGEIPEGLVVRHKCRTKNCVNLNHLELGTHSDNKNDMVRDRTLLKAEKAPRATFTNKQVRAIHLDWHKGLDSSFICSKHGVKCENLWNMVHGISWTSLGLDWERKIEPPIDREGPLTELEVRRIHYLWTEGHALAKLARSYNVSRATLQGIKEGRNGRWNSLRLEWFR